MGKLMNKRTAVRRRKRTTRPKKANHASLKRSLFGAIPGMEKWAIPELKRMRDEW